MFSKNLQGATVERVYWAVNVPSWLPVVGQNFDSPLEAKKYAEVRVSENQPVAAIETRMVLRYRENYPVPGTVDLAVETEYVDYNILIRKPLPENKY